MIKYRSTRGDKAEITGAKAIIKGLADDKGLFVPLDIPKIDPKSFLNLKYMDVAERIIGAFFDDYTEAEIKACVKGAYETNFNAEDVVPLVKAGDAWFLELYHGRTSAFKDMALSILPYLLTTAVKKEGEEKKVCILTATSGDTGKAALEGFSDVEGTEIIVFYPRDGVSAVQKAQMVTQEGENTHVYAIKGNFDDAQRGVKSIFNNEEFGERLAEKDVILSSANSINVGRLIPQIAYYVYAYVKMVESGAVEIGAPINVCVPTGNFGNILAAYFAGLMGIPINKYICASNKNKVLTDFINTGVYDTHRDFFLTNSPSMDILVSSNLERLLYLLSGNDTDEIKRLMEELDSCGRYEVGDDIKEGLKAFYGGFATVDDTNSAIGSMFRENKYLMDTHTAVAYKVYADYKVESEDATPTVIASTASPFKFADSVAKSIGLGELESDFDYVEKLSEAAGVAIPQGLKNLDKKPVLHDETIEIDAMEDAVLRALNI